MYIELSSNNFYEAERLFEDFRYHISVKGLLSGCVPGRIFADEERKSAAAITPQGIFLGGELENEVFFSNMNTVMKNDILPKYCEKRKLDYVVFYPQNLQGENACAVMFKDLNLMKSKRMTFSKDMSNIQAALPEGIFEVDEALLSNDEMPGLDGVIEEISGGWSSVEDFLNRGFGTAAILDGKIIGWCLTDWVVGDECEVGIETYQEYRNQGYGHKMALGTLALAKRHGLNRVGWQCWSDNAGSIATAKSAGFKLISEFTVQFAWAYELDNMLINGNYYMLGKKDFNIAPDYLRSAKCYEYSLERGWDWGGYVCLYWNCAIMFYKSGDIERAKSYYKLALEKGWNGVEDHKDNPYVYLEADRDEIVEVLVNEDL